MREGVVEGVLESGKVYLRHPDLQDWEEWAAIRDASRDFLIPWEPTWPADDLTKPAFRRRIRRYSRDIREDRAYPWFIFRKQDEKLAGGITLSNVRRGVTQACSVGYWMAEQYSRQGLMRDALRLVVANAFSNLKFHRVEAACLPTNEASRSLLKQTGFREEGYATQYLRINGSWQDHVLFGLVESDMPLPAVPAESRVT